MNGECKYKRTERTGLFIMVFAILAYIASISAGVWSIERKLNKIIKQQEQILEAK